MEKIEYNRGKKPSSMTYKLRNNLKEYESCVYCNKIFHRKDVEIEHPIPVYLGGEVQDFVISCNKCHKIKTKFDNNFFFFLKKTELLIKVSPGFYLIKDREEIVQIYNKLNSLWGGVKDFIF